MINENDEMEIDLLKFWETFKKVWGRCVLIVIVLTVLAFCGSKFLIPEKFTASSKLIIVQESTINNSQISYNDLQTSQKLVTTYSEIMKSEAILDVVIDNLRLDMTTTQLNDILTVESKSNTEIIDVSCTTIDPKLSARITNEVVNVFVNKIYDIMKVENVTVLNEAKVPEEKSGPSNVKNGLMGTALGIVISGLIVVYKTLTDTKVKTIEEVKAIFDYPIIGNIPLTDLDKYRKGDE